jgi:hypothetical protein
MDTAIIFPQAAVLTILNTNIRYFDDSTQENGITRHIQTLLIRCRMQPRNNARITGRQNMDQFVRLNLPTGKQALNYFLQDKTRHGAHCNGDAFLKSD